LLFFAIEGSRGRPLSDRTQEMGFRMGLAFVVALMLFVTFNDVWRIYTS
jgi:regulator of sigma E protease